jgi:c-di-GMP-binding flagellar brake protein YcgR
MSERRKLERFDLSAPARIIVESEKGEKEEFDLTTKDVSSSGAFLYSPQPLAEGTYVKMEFLISLDMLRKFVGDKDRAKIKVKGKVIRVDTNGIAIRFENKYKITGLDRGTYKTSQF